jgi:hypothetical protein
MYIRAALSSRLIKVGIGVDVITGLSVEVIVNVGVDAAVAVELGVGVAIAVGLDGDVALELGVLEGNIANPLLA